MATAVQAEIVAPPPRSTSFSPEFELLLACCQAPSYGNRLAQTLESGVDWDRVLRLAEHHRVLPTVHGALCGREDAPGSIKSALSSRFQNNELMVLRFSAELARITQAFGDARIEVLAHKGPVLSQLLYGDPAARQFGDLDLLVSSEEVARAKTVLRELGYRVQLQLSPRQEREYLRSGYEYVFALNDQRNLLELQWQILPRFYAVEFDLEAMFGRSIGLNLEGFRVLSLGREDLMLVLCVHAAKHGWAHLGMLRDIATLADMEIDWDWIFGEASRMGISRILAISLGLPRRFLSCPSPDALTAKFVDVEKFAEAIETKLCAGGEPDTQSLRYFHEFAWSRERWRDRARFWVRLALTPSVGEWEAVRLPDWLLPAYRAVRIGRLLKRAAGQRLNVR